ncbi:MAG TPA: cytochrome c biogenesis protein CcdA, partial [Planctomycetota bacterium]|nr:cytochrome c biogenesis protein CcdA [Planctomycetota bacterium]
AYALGIIIVFTGIGFLFSVLLGADGPRIFAASPWVNMAVGLLFFWFAFSLFGLYEINLPSWLTGSLANKQRSGVGGAFILGSLFSVVTFTCTIPFAANILTVAASSGAGNKFAGLVGMLIYSATMAAPFFVLGIFPSLLKEVPKSGGWLHTVKVTAAFGELALALMYFAKADQVTETGILTRSVMIAVWVAVLAVMALYLLGFFRMKEDGPPGPVGLPRTLIALSFGVLAVYMSSGFSGQALGAVDFLLPARAAEGFQNYDEALAEAKRSGKPLFVEFTGYT